MSRAQPRSAGILALYATPSVRCPRTPRESNSEPCTQQISTHARCKLPPPLNAKRFAWIKLMRVESHPEDGVRLFEPRIKASPEGPSNQFSWGPVEAGWDSCVEFETPRAFACQNVAWILISRENPSPSAAAAAAAAGSGSGSGGRPFPSLSRPRSSSAGDSASAAAARGGSGGRACPGGGGRRASR